MFHQTPHEECPGLTFSDDDDPGGHGARYAYDRRQSRNGIMALMKFGLSKYFKELPPSSGDSSTPATMIFLTTSECGRDFVESPLAAARRAPPPSSTSKLLQLPSELLFAILKEALLSSGVDILSTLSRSIHDHVNDIIYKRIVLEKESSIRLLRRTAVTRPHILSRVKKLVVSWEDDGRGDSYSTQRWLREIIAKCTSIHTLEIPVLDVSTIPDLSRHSQLVEVTAQYMEGGGCGGLMRGLSARLTHLRLVEPARYGSWTRPSSVLEEFGSPVSLTHLQLSRRTNANEENDAKFSENVRSILHDGETYPGLQMLVVSIYDAERWSGVKVEESCIWRLLKEIADPRLVVVEGREGALRDEWKRGSRLWRDLSIIPE